MEEKERFQQEMIRRLIPERDVAEAPGGREGAGGKAPGRPGGVGVAQTRTSGLRAQGARNLTGVEARTDSGLRKPAWQKDDTPALKTALVSYFCGIFREKFGFTE